MSDHEGMSYNEVRAMMEQLGQKPIAFHLAYAKLTGSVVAGLFLSQAVFYTTTYGRQTDGWFYQTYKQWSEDTMLSRRDIDNARKVLGTLEWSGRPLWEEHKRSVPAKLHYRVDLVVLGFMVAAIKDDQSVQTGTDDDQSEPDVTNKFDRSVQTRTVNGDKLERAKRTNKGAQGVQTKENQKENQREPERERPTSGPTRTDDPIEVTVLEPGTKAPTYASAKQRSYALGAVYYRAQQLAKADVGDRQWHATAKVMADVPERYTEDDIEGCVRYMLTDAWNREPGRLTPGRVVQTVPQWVAQGRPESKVPSRASRGGALTGDDWRHVAQQLRGQGE